MPTSQLLAVLCPCTPKYPPGMRWGKTAGKRKIIPYKNSRKSIHVIPRPLPNEITSSSAHTISTQRPTEAKINLFWRTKIDEGTPKSDPITFPLILQKEKKIFYHQRYWELCNSFFVQTNDGFILQQIKFTKKSLVLSLHLLLYLFPSESQYLYEDPHFMSFTNPILQMP